VSHAYQSHDKTKRRFSDFMAQEKHGYPSAPQAAYSRQRPKRNFRHPPSPSDRRTFIAPKHDKRSGSGYKIPCQHELYPTTPGIKIPNTLIAEQLAHYT
jgi:hypothetical protein